MSSIRHRLRRRLTRLLLCLDQGLLPRLLDASVRVKQGRLEPETLREQLESTFRELGQGGAGRGIAAVALAHHREALESTPYKYSLHGARWGSPAGGSLFRLASRLAALDGITFDVLVLREGAAIPPHAHVNTVSGMLVLEGDVGIRTFDVVSGSDAPDEVLLRARLSARMSTGDVSTLSDHHHNLHWVHGFAPISYILRLTITNIGDTLSEDQGRVLAREYCLPRDEMPDGLFRGEWVDLETARREPFPDLRVA